jgi:prephenate dehydratase
MHEARERALRIAYGGEPGAFAEDAVLAFAPAAEAVPRPGWRDVFEAVEGTVGERPDRLTPGAGGSVEAGVLPIENVLQGTVRETYDLLLAHRLRVVGEVIVPVRLCLAALPGQRLEAIERVYSHVQALGQAERFLRRRPWSLLTTYNTAGAGRLIAERQERGAAAVLSPRAAACYGLEVLVADIEDEADDRTRFLVVARPGSRLARRLPRPGAGTRMRTTLVLGLANRPGALHAALGILAEAGLNLSKLESRPDRDRAWSYVFWLDLDADARTPAARQALKHLRGATSWLRVLGTYPRAPEPT